MGDCVNTALEKKIIKSTSKKQKKDLKSIPLPDHNKNNELKTFDVILISNTKDSVSSGYPNTEKRVENTTHSAVFLTKFEVFG